MSLGGDRLVVRGGRAMKTRVARLARGLTLRREATHYPGGTLAQAISKSKCIRRAAPDSSFCMKGVFVRVDVLPD
jgi:hypothetical protein